MLQELVTPSGYRFWGESLVTIDGKDYPLDELTREQRSYVLAVRDVNALNAAYAGRAEFWAEGGIPGDRGGAREAKRGPCTSPAKWVVWGEPEQRSE